VTYAAPILIALALLTGFLALTAYEARRGLRLFAAPRAEFDRRVERLAFIATHVDLGAFVRDELRRMAGRVGHDVAQFSLQAVRFVERLLTRIVRYFRTHHDINAGSREHAREFVRTLSDFKTGLKATQPDIPDLSAGE